MAHRLGVLRAHVMAPVHAAWAWQQAQHAYWAQQAQQHVPQRPGPPAAQPPPQGWR